MKKNITIDAPSPLLRYGSGFYPVTSNPEQYHSPATGLPGTGVVTSSTGAAGSVSLQFNGTGVWIYGSKRASHGLYDVLVDTLRDNGLSGTTEAGKEEYQALLYNATFAYGTHQLTVINTGWGNSSNTNPAYLDIDYVVIETNLQDGAKDRIFEDDDVAVEYLPGPSPWWDYTKADGKDSDSTAHFSQSDQAGLRFNFSGEAVSLYGQLDANHGNYSVSLDGAPAVLYNGTYGIPAYQQLLFHASGLGQGRHSISVKNIPTSTDHPWFAVDYAQAFGTNLDTPRTKSSNTGSIVGGVIGGVVALVAIGAALWWWFIGRHRRRSRREEKPDIDMGSSSTDVNDHVTPFNVYTDDDHGEHGHGDRNSNAMTTVSSGENGYAGYPQQRNRQSYGYPTTPSHNASTFQSSRYSNGNSTAYGGQASEFGAHPQHDEDAGPLFSTRGQELGGMLPPTYDTVSNAGGTAPSAGGYGTTTNGYRDEKGNDGNRNRSLRAVNEDEREAGSHQGPSEESRRR